jgi:hypothetical protein
MHGTSWKVGLLATLFALMLCAVRAEEAKPTDEGKVEDFKSKTFTIKEKEKAAITLAFPAGKKFTITVRGGDKKTDVNLFIYNADKKVVAKDDSPGPNCDIDFTPKEAGKYTLEVVNLGPGDIKSTLKVAAAK